jgi:hypothetical protein
MGNEIVKLMRATDSLRFPIPPLPCLLSCIHQFAKYYLLASRNRISGRSVSRSPDRHSLFPCRGCWLDVLVIWPRLDWGTNGCNEMDINKNCRYG